MRLSELIEVIENAVPLTLQEGYDNSGLIIGEPQRNIDSALLCVDITEKVLDEAIAEKTDVIISHHPVIFHPLKKITGTDHIQRIVAKAIKHDIALYACHTNLDAVGGGMSYRLAEILGIEADGVLSARAADGDGSGFGITGSLPSPMNPVDFFILMKRKLGLKVIRYNTLCREQISRVALCTGAGASLIGKAADAGADIYIAADFKYNDFLDADRRLIIADIGHYESEYCAIDLLFDIIKKKIPTFALHKSECSENPVNYFV